MKILYSSCIKNPEHTRFEGEDKDEVVVLTLRQHQITNLRWAVVGALLFCGPFLMRWFLVFTDLAPIPVLPFTYRLVLVIFWYLISLSYIFTSFLIWFFSVYLVSNKRVIDIDFHGFFGRSFSEALLSNIEDLTHTIYGISQVFFKYGTLNFQTAGELREIEFENIPNPGMVQDIVSDLAAKSGGLRRGRRDDD